MKHSDSADGLSTDLGSVLTSEYDSDGVLNVQIDAYGGGATASTEVHAPYGFVSRPKDADVDANGTPLAACKAFISYEGDRSHAWLSADYRITAALPQLDHGESMIHGPSGNLFRCFADGHVAAVARSVVLGNGPNQIPVTLATPLASILSDLDTLLQALSVLLLKPVVNGSPVDPGTFADALQNYLSAKATLVQQMASSFTTSS